MMDMTSRRNVAIAFLITVLQCQQASAYSLSASSTCCGLGGYTSPISRIGNGSIGIGRRPRCGPSNTRLDMAVNLPMRPMEDEKEDNKKKRGEWKKVVGGFVPRFLKQRFAANTAVGDVIPTGDAAANTKQPASRRIRQQRSGQQKNPDVITVMTMEDYKRVVVDEPDRLVVVRFHASWCKSCKASYPYFLRMVAKHGLSGKVLFVDAPLTKETAFLHEGLGVPTVPFGHVYHPAAGLVEERKLNKKVFRDFETAVDSYVRGSCDLPMDEEEDVVVETEKQGSFLVESDAEESFQ